MKVYKRGNRWFFDHFQDGCRVRFSLGADIKSEPDALAWLDNYIRNENAITLRNFISQYLDESRIRISQNTFECYKNSLKAFESHFGVDRKIGSISSREIAIWSSTRLCSGLSPESVNVDLRVVKAFFNRAVLWELIDKAPRIEMVKTPKRLPRHLTHDQFQSILLNEPEERFRCLFIFMVWTGVRRGEALSLRWEDLTFGKRPQALITGKGDKQRVIPLLPPAVDALGSPSDFGFVFPQLNEDYISHRFLFAARRAGIKAKLHDLRHTALTWMIGQGVPIKLVQEVAGHTDIKTTMGYAKSFSGVAYDTLIKAFAFNVTV